MQKPDILIPELFDYQKKMTAENRMAAATQFLDN
jgi:hypothetical protein